MKRDVLIIGAGAAGLMAAIEAGRRGRSVLVMDHAKAPGEKIRISGGGRCNFTNLNIEPDRFLSNNPRFALSALRRFSQWDFIAMVDDAGIAWHEKTLGQLFCDGSSKQIVALLMNHARDAGVEVALQTSLERIERGADGFRAMLSSGPVEAASVIVACGGPSIPKMGATGMGYDLAAQFGLPVVPPRPALVPLTFGAHELEQIAPLAGASVSARVSCGAAAFDEGLLFTHRGLSGPSVLQISSYWREGDTITVDLARGADVAQALRDDRQQRGRVAVKTALAQHLPDRVAAAAVARAGLTGNLADQSDAALDALGDQVHRWQLVPAGSEGYRTAEVTLGGVDTDALNAKTMEARSVPGLYFIGEVVDVTGWLGGYNFQWAWSSGWAAGQVA